MAACDQSAAPFPRSLSAFKAKVSSNETTSRFDFFHKENTMTQRAGGILWSSTGRNLQTGRGGTEVADDNVPLGCLATLFVAACLAAIMLVYFGWKVLLATWS
jgi:hypothetical protein